MIILGVDPGLTRCGVGVIEAGEHRRLSFIHVDVVRSSPDITQDLRLLAIYNGLSEKMDGDTYFEPHQNADSRRCRRCLGFGHLPCAAPGRRIAGRRTRTTSDRRATPVG